MARYARITTLEYMDQKSTEALSKEYVEKLIPKYRELGAVGLMAIRVGPRSVAYVSRYESKDQADTASAKIRAEVLRQFTQHIVAPPMTVSGEVIGESVD